MRAGYARAYAKYQARVAPATSRSLSNSSRETGRPLEKTSEYGNGRGLVPSQARPERPTTETGKSSTSMSRSWHPGAELLAGVGEWSP